VGDFLIHLPVRLLIAVVRGYRFFLSPWLGSACRFEPTCSAYSLTALQQHGAAGGSYLTLRRLARCHPWCDGGRDPVPGRLPGLFTRHVENPSQDGGSHADPSSPLRQKLLP
jgi:putative membrane protein insertion efficiency factor